MKNLIANPIEVKPISVTANVARDWLKNNNLQEVDAKPMATKLQRKNSVLELHGVTKEEYTRAGGTL